MAKPTTQQTGPGLPDRALCVNSRRVTHPMPDFALFEVVDLMKVPVEKSSEALIAVLGAADALYSRGKGGGVDANIKAFKTIARLSKPFLKELEGLNGPGRFYLGISGGQNPISFAAYVGATRRMMENAALMGQRKRPRFKPTGFTHEPLSFLVCELERASQRTGGTLTLGKNSEGKPTGSLPDIARIFNKYSPLIPAQVSYSTWYRLRRHARDQVRKHKRHYGTPQVAHGTPQVAPIYVRKV